MDRRQIVYLNLEDDRLHPLRAGELDLVLRCCHEVFPEMELGVARWPNAEGRLLFHEYVPGQERAVRGAVPVWKYLLSSVRGDGR